MDQLPPVWLKFTFLKYNCRSSFSYLQRIQLLPEWLCSRSNNVCWLQLDSVTFEFFWTEKLFQSRSQDPSWLQLPFDWLVFLKDHLPNHTQELHGTKTNIGLGKYKLYNHIKYFGLFHDYNVFYKAKLSLRRKVLRNRPKCQWSEYSTG